MHPTLKRLRFALMPFVGGFVALCIAGSAPGGLAGTASAGTAFETSSPVNLVFTKASATLLGSEALVQVRCEGPRGGICNGTVVLRVQGEKHKVPFAVNGGSRSSLAVSVGAADPLQGKRAVALARTVQRGGGYLRAREVLRLK
jgi:hypothetical protein